jgi:hypothetical protein
MNFKPVLNFSSLSEETLPNSFSAALTSFADGSFSVGVSSSSDLVVCFVCLF